MSFGLGRGRVLDDAPGVVGVTSSELPELPDAALTDPAAGRLDPRAWFPHPSRPLEIEIGPGKGSFLLAHARAHPGMNLLGVEWAREFYLYTADRVRRGRREDASPLDNVRVLHADGAEFLRWRVRDGVARAVHLYFSDPWPKTKHHKNRVVQDRFLAEVWRVLEPGGDLRVVTDHDGLWEWDRAHFRRWSLPPAGERPGPPAFEWLDFEAPSWAGEGEVVGTNYERKMCVEGKRPHACRLKKIP